MLLKTINNIFGYGLVGVGISKIIFTILIFLQMFTNVNSVLNGSTNINYEYYPTFTIILGSVQLFLALGSIIMLILNIVKYPKLIPGYLLGLLAILIEFITPSFLYIFFVFAECGIYIKAGYKIINNNENYNNTFLKSKTNKKLIKNSEWFFDDKNIQVNTQKEKNIQKKIQKIDQEIYEWKQLLDSGEITEDIYNEEKNRLIEKKKKIMK